MPRKGSDSNFDELLKQTAPPQRASHMGAQFEPAQFTNDDILPEHIRPYHRGLVPGSGVLDKTGVQQYEEQRAADIEMGEDRTRIGDRTYPSFPRAHEYDAQGNKGAISHVTIPTESGWHADVTKHHVQPVYYADIEADNPDTSMEEPITRMLGTRAHKVPKGVSPAHHEEFAQRASADRKSEFAPGMMSVNDVNKVFDSPQLQMTGAGEHVGAPSMRIGMKGQHWALEPEGSTLYPEVHRSAMFLNEQGIHKAIDKISTMPRPQDMGPPRPLERFKRATREGE